jgi:hypothetical protein
MLFGVRETPGQWFPLSAAGFLDPQDENVYKSGRVVVDCGGPA